MVILLKKDLHLTDLIDAATLKELQYSFCKLTGINADINDIDGHAVTRSPFSSEFCSKYTKGSPIGRKRCENCDIKGGELALEKGDCVIYKCHAGLVDFACPIMVENEPIGSFIGGQVVTSPLDEEKVRALALELGVDPDGYVEAAKKITVIEKETLKNATDLLKTVANILSNVAYHGYLAIKTNEEIERTAKMKSDFLANMSHEIRTPMNAVIGMADMALREELPTNARDYIHQIKASGKTLLAIINDILDFSKIESGKMSIIPVEYNPLELINEVSNVIQTRIGEKTLELLVDAEPDIPLMLRGDTVRIKQIITNLANNAIKFTEEGYVYIKVRFKKFDNKKLYLTFSVEDTGIGIKPEDTKRLFKSFEQVDSKRNRNIEGTGLGLSITKQLLNLMGGDISISSEYGKGSTFWFFLPQEIVDNTPCVSLSSSKPIKASIATDNLHVKEQLKRDFSRFKIKYTHIRSFNDYETLLSENVDYLFIDEILFSDRVLEFAKLNPAITFVIMSNFKSSKKYPLPNIIILHKPLFSYNIASVFNGGAMEKTDDKEDNFSFIAPDAEVLIVDDNAVNLTVAAGLLTPLQMKIDTASSGMEAITKISAKHYDLIFMDHMMPDIDGVETTHIIRRFHPEYADVPIVALTANAVEGTKAMFLEEGMNDYVPKPIEMSVITTVLKNWLPTEKIIMVDRPVVETNFAFEEADVLRIEGLDTVAALKLLGSEELFMDVLKDYYKVIEKKATLIDNLMKAKDWPAYTIEVHALKSASKQIGAIELSNMAAEMEKAGNSRNGKLIYKNTGPMLDLYLRYKDILEPLFAETHIDESSKKDISKDELVSLFENIHEALDNLDMDSMDALSNELKTYRFDESQTELLNNLLSAVDEWDVDSCLEILDEWKSVIK